MPSRLARLRVRDVTPSQRFRQLSRTYCCYDRDMVVAYLREFPFVAPALMYAAPKLREYFPDAQLILDVTVLRTGHKKMHIVVKTRRWGREIGVHVEDFDAWWWDEVCRTLDGISVTEEEEDNPLRHEPTRSHEAQKQMRSLALAL